MIASPYLLHQVYNVGTGKSSSVIDLIRTFELVSKMPVPYVMKERRHGDIVAMYADTRLTKEELGWEARFDLLRMCTINESFNPAHYLLRASLIVCTI